MFWGAWSPPAIAFDTGHHADLTHEVMAEQGFNQTAIEVAQVENWLVDYYSSQPIAGLKEDLERLHFDNLFTEVKVKNAWDNLAVNTQRAVQQAAREQNALKIVALFGISLHAVQDFYTHSNWAALHPGQGDGYSTLTWFDTTDRTGVYTGRYDREGDQPEHGGYDFGLNHDSYVRPGWDKAYVFAYSGSRQWMHHIRDWVNEVDPDMWSEALALSLPSGDLTALSADLAAVYRISEWIDVGEQDGHWKGNGSGSNTEFLAFTTMWTASPDSIFVDHFKEDRWFESLIVGLDSGRAPTQPVPDIRSVLMDKKAVIVRSLSVKEDDTRFFERAIDPGGEPDFYASITIAGQRFIEAMQLERASIRPSWTSIKFVDSSETTIPIQYELWDEDGGTGGDDDLCDIYPGTGYTLDFSLNTDSLSLSGDVQGIHNSAETVVISKGNASDRAEVSFFVTRHLLQ